MKELIKKTLPSPLIRVARKATRAKISRKKPLITSYSGEDFSVLQCCIAYNKYGGFCIPLKSYHRPAAQKVMSGKVYEQETIDYLVKSVTKAGDIIHAGTYFGDFLPALSSACTDGAKIWAFEPNPENYRCATITISINNLQNVDLTNAGLGSERGTFYMRVLDEGGRALGGASHFIGDEIENKNQLTEVEIVKIDDAVPSNRQVSILQLDVEGFEKYALMGAISTIERNKPLLMLENLPEESWLSDNIFQFGYKVIGDINGNTILYPE